MDSRVVSPLDRNHCEESAQLPQTPEEWELGDLSRRKDDLEAECSRLRERLREQSQTYIQRESDLLLELADTRRRLLAEAEAAKKSEADARLAWGIERVGLDSALSNERARGETEYERYMAHLAKLEKERDEKERLRRREEKRCESYEHFVSELERKKEILQVKLGDSRELVAQFSEDAARCLVAIDSLSQERERLKDQLEANRRQSDRLVEGERQRILNALIEPLDCVRFAAAHDQLDEVKRLLERASEEFAEIGVHFGLARDERLSASEAAQLLRTAKRKLKQLPRTELWYEVVGQGRSRERRTYLKRDCLAFLARGLKKDSGSKSTWPLSDS